MDKQIKPEQIIKRIEALDSERVQKGYKPGWMFFQMKQRVEQAGAALACYRGWNNLSPSYCYLADLAGKYAKRQMSLAEIKDELVAAYEDWMGLDQLAAQF